jgi:hypothetical protein
MERPKTPGLYDSDLQQGDVQAMEQGQRIAPIQQQKQSRTSQRPRRRQESPAKPRGGAQGDVPDPIDFLGDRLGGTLGDPTQSTAADNAAQIREWIPLLQKLATATGASGVLGQAYITQLRNARQRPFTHMTPLLDMQDADDDLELLLRG